MTPEEEEQLKRVTEEKKNFKPPTKEEWEELCKKFGSVDIDAPSRPPPKHS